jgi:hypothetical protein
MSKLQKSITMKGIRADNDLLENAEHGQQTRWPQNNLPACKDTTF